MTPNTKVRKHKRGINGKESERKALLRQFTSASRRLVKFAVDDNMERYSKVDKKLGELKDVMGKTFEKEYRKLGGDPNEL